MCGGDKPQENAGKRDQKSSELKKAGDHVKNAFKKKWSLGCTGAGT